MLPRGRERSREKREVGKSTEVTSENNIIQIACIPNQQGSSGTGQRELAHPRALS